MGRAGTFAGFLSWGVENYASAHMGVVLWNHGGGCITGVCFDETDDYDSLSLRELDAALLSVCDGAGRKFDFFGFDVCLMGTLETANILATYADYMIASEEMEPGAGWDYTSIGRYLGANPDADGASAALTALKNVVAYSVSGSAHKSASGLSMYYPLKAEGSEELSTFSDVCPSPYYISFVDRQRQSGESQYITFAVEPHLDTNGSFWFELDDNGYNYAADVYGIVYELSPDGEDAIELGETYDLDGGWGTGRFADDFDGWWISLPDGQNLATYIVEDNDDYTIYTSPIRLNGEETNLRIKLDYSAEKIAIEGAWDGVSEYGALSRNIVKLQRGDVITPLYYAYSLETDDEFYYYGEEYTFTGAPEVNYSIMEDGDYLYAFCIDDIYGDYYLSDFVSFSIEGDKVFFTAEQE